jgi:hypothetical protein
MSCEGSWQRLKRFFNRVAVKSFNQYLPDTFTMKFLLALAILIVTFSTLHAQEEDLVIGFACTRGEPTDAVKTVEQFLTAESYKGIAALLTANPARQYVAVITLQRLQQVKKYKPTTEELRAIAAVKNSEMIVWICEGPTFWEKHSLKEVFEKYPEFGKWWLDEHISG